MSSHVVVLLVFLHFVLEPLTDGKAISQQEMKNSNKSNRFMRIMVKPQLSIPKSQNHTLKRRRVEPRWEVLKIDVEDGNYEVSRQNNRAFNAMRDEDHKAAHRNIETKSESERYVIVKTDEETYNLTIAFAILIISMLILIITVLGITLYYFNEISQNLEINKIDQQLTQYNYNDVIYRDDEEEYGPKINNNQNDGTYWWDKWDTRPKVIGTIPAKESSTQNAGTQTLKEVDAEINTVETPSDVRQQKLTKLFPGTSTDTVSSLESRKYQNPFKAKNLLSCNSSMATLNHETNPNEDTNWHEVTLVKSKHSYTSVPNNLESVVFGKVMPNEGSSTSSVCSTSSAVPVPILPVSNQPKKFAASNTFPWFKNLKTVDRMRTNEQGSGRMKVTKFTRTTLDTLREDALH